MARLWQADPAREPGGGAVRDGRLAAGGLILLLALEGIFPWRHFTGVVVIRAFC